MKKTTTKRQRGQRKAGRKTGTSQTATECPSSSDTLSNLESFETRVLPKHAANMLIGMEVMWHQNDLCDVTIIAEGHRFYAHRAVLSACADYFHTNFSNVPHEQNQGRNYEIILDFASSATVSIILECMYTGKVRISESNVRDLLVAASHLRFYAVEQVCGDFLKSRLNHSNCLRMLNLAVTYGLFDLVEESLHIAAANFIQVSDGFDYQQLEIDHIVMLLERDDIKVITIK